MITTAKILAFTKALADYRGYRHYSEIGHEEASALLEAFYALDSQRDVAIAHDKTAFGAIVMIQEMIGSCDGIIRAELQLVLGRVRRILANSILDGAEPAKVEAPADPAPAQAAE